MIILAIAILVAATIDMAVRANQRRNEILRIALADIDARREQQ